VIYGPTRPPQRRFGKVETLGEIVSNISSKRAQANEKLQLHSYLANILAN
jgi:hypothetical protein